jgi:Mg2+-importing ATPase
LLFSSLAVVFFSVILPFTPVGNLFGLEPPPMLFFPILAGLVTTYLLLVEIVKKQFMKRFPTA